jgi:hypothetical protein
MMQSNWVSLDEAFDDCVNRLHAGQSVNDCLRAYPQHADLLRGLLDMARLVRQANPTVPSGARARVWARVAPAVAPRRIVASWRVRAALAASVAMVILVAVLLSQRDDHPDHPLTVIPLATSTATPTVALSITPAPTLTATPTSTPTVSSTPTLSLAVSPSTTPASTPTAFATPDLVCLFTVEASSVNLRNGPGTGYGVAAYGFAGDQFPVVATHTSGQWLEVTVNEVGVWVSVSVGVLSGDCTGLPVSTISLQEGTGDPGTGGGAATSVPGGAGEGGGNDNEVGDDGGDSVDDSSNDNNSNDNSGDDSSGHGGGGDSGNDNG